MEAIVVENIGKKYNLKKNRQSTLNGAFNNFFKRRKEVEDFWALRNISFSIKKGESVGVIGKNGAGKSTLLKILSKIVHPTEGLARIHGKVASLLEIGTGFHPELTGRENVFLNGSLLGMSRFEIKTKFDQIVDFSGIEKFIDMPVKHYSSGMYVRLGFSVAAHLSSEILIVDEVLSVGDLEFQEKCINSINGINEKGRTILLVSHNLGVIKSICSSAIYLNEGNLINYDSCENIVSQYLNKNTESEKIVNKGPIIKIEFIGLSNILEFKIHYKVSDLVFPNLDAIVSNQFGQPLFGSNSRYTRIEKTDTYPNEGILSLRFSNINIRSGKYYFSLWFGSTKAGYDISLKDVMLFHYENLQIEAGSLNPNHYGQVIPDFSLEALT